MTSHPDLAHEIASAVDDVLAESGASASFCDRFKALIRNTTLNNTTESDLRRVIDSAPDPYPEEL